MDDKLNLTEDHSIWLSKDIRSVLQEVYDHFRSINNRNKYLEKEIERVKSEKYKDEELAKMKSEYDRMKEDYFLGFPISKEQWEKIKEWQGKIIDKYPTGKTAIGGRFKYIFYPTSIGTSGEIKDNISGEVFEFQKLG